MILFFLCIVVVIGLIIYIMRKKEKSGRVSNIGTNATELDSSKKSTIHFSDEFKGEESVTTVEKDHIITTLYMNKENKYIWICPICETENPSSENKCLLCHALKQ